jgi:AraC family transcriptional regulator of adaptative response/methylated-DNA-[protein]-cysteine methyltransferase
VHTTELIDIDSAAWQAVLQRDRDQDGAFVYVALTTGIYCRPSCPARHPHPRNTVLVQSGPEAERLGYAACRRCHPDALAPAERSIRRVLIYIEDHLGDATTLRVMSAVSGLSPNHLQQTFQRVVGLSPKVYADARRLARFKERLRRGESISGACYAAGYGSSRALYERARRHLGMTPAAYRRGGVGTDVRYVGIESALGVVLLGATREGVCAIHVGDDERTVMRRLQEEFPRAFLAPDRHAPPRWTAAVASGQREDPLIARLPREFRVALLQAKVWKDLAGRTG